MIKEVDVVFLYRKAGFRSPPFIRLEVESIFADRCTISEEEYCSIAKMLYDKGLLKASDYIKAVEGRLFYD